MVVYRGYKTSAGVSPLYKGCLPCMALLPGWKADWRLRGVLTERQPRFGAYATAMVLLVDLGIDANTAACMVGPFAKEFWKEQFHEAWKVDSQTLWEWAHSIGVDS